MHGLKKTVTNDGRHERYNKLLEQRLSNYYQRKRSSSNEAQTKSNSDDENNTSQSSVEQNPVKKYLRRLIQ